jgi:hypothetical protein
MADPDTEKAESVDVAAALISDDRIRVSVSVPDCISKEADRRLAETNQTGDEELKREFILERIDLQLSNV